MAHASTGQVASTLIETSGPTALTMSSIADGEILYRSGTTIDGQVLAKAAEDYWKGWAASKLGVAPQSMRWWWDDFNVACGADTQEWTRNVTGGTAITPVTGSVWRFATDTTASKVSRAFRAAYAAPMLAGGTADKFVYGGRFAITTATDAQTIARLGAIDGSANVLSGGIGSFGGATYAVVAPNGGAPTIDTGVSVDTAYHAFAIYLTAKALQVYVDGSLVGSSADAWWNTAWSPIVGAENGLTAANRVMDLDYVFVGTVRA
jgi:hypothetical protein